MRSNRTWHGLIANGNRDAALAARGSHREEGCSTRRYPGWLASRVRIPDCEEADVTDGNSVCDDSWVWMASSSRTSAARSSCRTPIPASISRWSTRRSGVSRSRLLPSRHRSCQQRHPLGETFTRNAIEALPLTNGPTLQTFLGLAPGIVIADSMETVAQFTAGGRIIVVT